MAKMNGKNIRIESEAPGLERELPPAEDDGFVEQEAAQERAGSQAAAADELQKLKMERDVLVDRVARQQAEFENYRKRNAREQQDFRDYAIANAVQSLLPVLDSLDLALRNSAGEQSEIRSGVELVRNQFTDALARLGLREVPTEGAIFDPQVHQAMEMVDTAEAPDHQILQELQRGYTLKERLLRPAMVRVARNPRR